jgi:hypothetical protein
MISRISGAIYGQPPVRDDRVVCWDRLGPRRAQVDGEAEQPLCGVHSFEGKVCYMRNTTSVAKNLAYIPMLIG